MRRYLCTYCDNWADEIDIDGICVIGEDRYKKFKKKAENFKRGSFHIGSNEEIEHNIEDEFKFEDVINFEEISEDEFKILKKLKLESIGFASKFIGFVIGENDEDDEDNE